MHIDKDETTGCEPFHPEFPIGSAYAHSDGEVFKIVEHEFGRIKMSDGSLIKIETFRSFLKFEVLKPIQ